MPDRFNLMTDDDVRSAFRITSDYCRLVNPRRLSTEDIVRLDQGRTWLHALAVEVRLALDNEALRSELLHLPPVADSVSPSVEQALADFAAASDSARTTCIDRLLASPELVLTTPNGNVSALDLARHLARISNTCSVDQRWVWGTP